MKNSAKDFPVNFIKLEQFITYFDYVKSLGFTDDPNYEYLTNLFVEIMKDHCSEITYDFDWDNNLRSTATLAYLQMSTIQKASTSLNVVGNNVSQYSPNNKASDSLIQIEDNNLSIFQKDDGKYFLIILEILNRVSSKIMK